MKRIVDRSVIVRAVFGVAVSGMVLGYAGCRSVPAEKVETAEPVAEKPLRVAVFVDRGARSVGAYQWLALTTLAQNVQTTPVDGAAIRAGVLDETDVLVMPGGRSVQEARMLEAEGREKVKAFLKRGGGYVGTCAGCCLLMEPTTHHPDMLNVIPFKFGPSGGHADLLIRFNRRAEELAGITTKEMRIRYSEGPVPLPSLPVDDAEIEVVGTFACDINSESMSPRPSFAGQAAAFAGTYGKGRIFVTAVHPEYDLADHAIVRAMFRYVTHGREVTWTYPQRRRGQLALGIICDDSFGVESARFLQRLLREPTFDCIPLNSTLISEGALRHLDAVIAPAGTRSTTLSAGLYGRNLGRTKEFLARGGQIFAWGSAGEAAHTNALSQATVSNQGSAQANVPSVTVVADQEAALQALTAFAKTALPQPSTLPGPAEKRIRTAVYSDTGGSNYTVTSMLKFAPEYDVTFLSAEAIRKGALDGFDLLIQPGGGCNSQYQTLGTNGTAAIERFVRNGGAYYGICAGAYLATQTTDKALPRIGFAPYKADKPNHYRGWGPIDIKLTPEGLNVFTGSATNRTVVYWGGPALLDGDPVPDADMKVFARYNGLLINTCSSRPVQELGGKAAIVGGRFGKGKVFLSGPHPEHSEYNFDLVRSGLAFLTGVAPTPVNHDRVRGAVSVFFRTTNTPEAASFYLHTLLPDRRFDVCLDDSVDVNRLPHSDVVILPAFGKGDATPALKAFIANGGQVVLVADTEKERQDAPLIKGATVVSSYAEVIPAILK